MFKLRSLILYLFLLKLKVLFDSVLNYIDKYFGVTKILLKKSFEICLEQKFYLIPIFVLVRTETDLPINKRDSK